MSKRKFLVLLVVLALLLGTSNSLTLAQEGEIRLTITCRCVAGGVNAVLVDWLNQSVIPSFEENMAAQARTSK